MSFSRNSPLIDFQLFLNILILSSWEKELEISNQSSVFSENKLKSMSNNDNNKKQPLNTSLLKGFFAGVVFSHINKRFVIGTLVGTAVGIFIEQNFQDIPNVKIITNDWMETLKTAVKPKK